MPLNRREFLHQTAGGAVAASLLGTAVLAPRTAATAAAAEAAGPLIIDTHQHLWDLSKFDLPWLDGVPDILKHSYRTEEYRAATQGLNVKAVYMEVDVAQRQLVQEAEYVIDLVRSGQSPTLGGVIGGRPFLATFPAYIRRFQGNPLIKGVRRVLHIPETPPGFCVSDAFVRGVRQLGDAGLSFDLCMRPTDLRDGIKLTELCPNTRFVLDHCGNGDVKAFRPLRAGEERPAHNANDWRRAIEAFAKRPNAICKISGIVARLPEGGGAEELAPIINHCLDSFGPDRVVFGGDWPVCLLGASLRRWVEMLGQIIATRPAAEQRKLWSENAIKFYGLKV